MQRVDVAIIGAGQAGLAVARSLAPRGIDHVVLERRRVAQTWRERWDSFCLVTPNWAIDLPGATYDGTDPDGYMVRDDVVGFFERYAQVGDSPIHEGVEVSSVRTVADGFTLDTSDGELRARAVVLCTGAYQRPHRPPGAATLPADLLTLDALDYRRPDDLPPGAVLIVGSGQTGCQLAEELHEDGRDVVLACGKAPWVPRRFAGHDVVWWGVRDGFLDQTVESLPDPRLRLTSNLLATGHGGGHDLHYRTLRDLGVTLTGHFLGADGTDLLFADDLPASVAWGDERHHQFMELAAGYAESQGIPFEVAVPAPFTTPGPERIPLDRISSVLFAGGYRPDYGSLLPSPEAVDAMGFPLHHDGASTVVDGLFFCGVHFLRKRKSSILWGIREDAEIVVGAVAERLGR